jgi:hypothetical protein
VILQHRTFCKVLKRSPVPEGEEEKSQTLAFHFYLGPIRFGCIVNVPRNGRDTAPVYIQMEVHVKTRDWTSIPVDGKPEGSNDP